MPITSNRTILFIHIPKNAGKSVEEALEICSPEELVGKKWRSLPNRAATLLQRLTADKGALPRLWGIIDVSLTAQHLTFAEICLLGLVNEAVLRQMTKFAVCRNPYDRAVSTFAHMAGDYEKTPAGFEAFWQAWPLSSPADHNLRAHRRCQWEFCVGLDGKNAMDHVLRYENLQSEFADFTGAVLNGRAELPWQGQGRRVRDYRDYYNQQSQHLIRSRFERDFDFFGYSTEL